MDEKKMEILEDGTIVIDGVQYEMKPKQQAEKKKPKFEKTKRALPFVGGGIGLAALSFLAGAALGGGKSNAGYYETPSSDPDFSSNPADFQ